ncbi:unnamed protein product [Rotaria magnacalcarata]|uniref:Uncharacterized protein n=1 Tax=Rotaria magnacalcarata TaxID=392030 RepID=A0A816NB37_9BILA|nr:unnamed protein product [Rotaria magnacalcarata]CAF1370613.1 unnamed protein product [Rotaria magnacalcarata]CAF1935308.1 unnamed protein product [Rotaria magnacalcarata]CAF2033458.1 unnamed protein product [Rotaria magnacalcarata]CAF2118460.1 unnamed protein product [Rotaria magnacalcarata]
MSSSIVRRQKFRKTTIQPIDRHLTETENSDGSIYVNAGIDSTCCKKLGRTIHTLINGIVVSPLQTRIGIKLVIDGSIDDFSLELGNDNANDYQLDAIPTKSCLHCGK